MIDELPARVPLQTAAEYMGVSVKTVRRYIADGRLKAVRMGPRLIRVDRQSIEKLMKPIGRR